MNADDFRRIALKMEGTVEGAHIGHPDFRGNGRIFATISPDGKSGMVKLTPDQQQGYLDEYSGVFTPASGAWGQAGATMVLLRSADKAVVRGAVQLAWQNVQKKSAAGRSKTGNL